MDDCMFCKLVKGEIPGQVVHRSDKVTAFRDINPQAPVHILVIPNEHITGLRQVTLGHAGMIAEMIQVANELARQEGVADSGYRFVINQGPNAGQSVFHLHAHLLGGRHFRWPPG